jgi:hypothetical protein
MLRKHESSIKEKRRKLHTHKNTDLSHLVAICQIYVAFIFCLSLAPLDKTPKNAIQKFKPKELGAPYILTGVRCLRQINWSPPTFGHYFMFKNGSIGWAHMHGPSPSGLWAPLRPVGTPRRVQMCLNQSKPQSGGLAIPHAAPYLDLGDIGQLSRRIPVGHVTARRCVSKLAKLENIARFQSKVGTVLIGRETMCGVILRGDEY